MKSQTQHSRLWVAAAALALVLPAGWALVRVGARDADPTAALGVRLGMTAADVRARVTLDEGLLSAAVRSTFETLGPLAFGPDVRPTDVTAEVTNLGLSTAADGAPDANGTLTFTVTFDPGDGARTTAASVPVTCTPTTAP